MALRVFRAPASSQYPFDHTSFIKTFLRWAGVDPNSATLGKRMPQAPTFEGVFSSSIVNDATFQAPPMQSGLNTVDETSGPAGPGQPLNALFEGMPFAAVRSILHDAVTIADIHEAIASYRANPAAYDE